MSTGDANPLAEPPLPAVPEAAEGSLPRAPGPAIPADIAEHGSTAGRAAQEAQPDAAAQPVMTGVDRGTAVEQQPVQDGVSPVKVSDTQPGGLPPKFYVVPADFETEAARPPSPVGVADVQREDSAPDSGKSSECGDDSCDAAEQGDRAANLTISTGVKGGLKMHDSSAESAAESPAMSRQNRCPATCPVQRMQICVQPRGVAISSCRSIVDSSTCARQR